MKKHGIQAIPGGRRKVLVVETRSPAPEMPPRHGETHMGANYTEDQVEFIKAMDKYRVSQRRPFPSCCEILMVLKSLGYRRAV